jgi:hypothetical protein
MVKKTTIQLTENIRDVIKKNKNSNESYSDYIGRILQDNTEEEKPSVKQHRHRENKSGGSIFNVEELKEEPAKAEDEWELIYNLPLAQMHHILNPNKQDCGERACIDIRRWLDKRIDNRVRKVIENASDTEET